MRLVDADELLDKAKGTDAYFAVKGLLTEIPTADAAPVVHGRWKYCREKGVAVCMECSFERRLDDNFGRAIACPNCGAKMDGEVTGDV